MFISDTSAPKIFKIHLVRIVLYLNKIPVADHAPTRVPKNNLFQKTSLKRSKLLSHPESTPRVRNTLFSRPPDILLTWQETPTHMRVSATQPL